MKKFLAAFLSALLVFALAACGSTPPATSDAGTDPMASTSARGEDMPNYKIGYLVKTMGNSVWQTYAEAAQQAAADLGVTVEVRDVATEGDYLEQYNVALTMVNQDFDAIIAASITNSNLIAAIAEANEKDIPWIVVGEYQDETILEQKNAYVTANCVMNYYDEGVAIAEYVAEQLNYEGEVAVVEGTAGLGYTIAMNEAYADVFSKYPDIKIVAAQSGDWERETAYNVTLGMLQANPNLKALIVMNDTMALGSMAAVEAAGKTGDIIITGADATPDALDAVKAGTLAMTADVCAWQIAYYSVCAAVKALDEDLKTVEDYSFTPCLVTQDNVDEVLASAPRTIEEMYDVNPNIYLPLPGRLEE